MTTFISQQNIDKQRLSIFLRDLAGDVKVNLKHMIEDLDKEKALEILNKISKGEKPIPGSYRGRVNNEPENNRTTLMDLKNA